MCGFEVALSRGPPQGVPSNKDTPMYFFLNLDTHLFFGRGNGGRSWQLHQPGPTHFCGLGRERGRVPLHSCEFGQTIAASERFLVLSWVFSVGRPFHALSVCPEMWTVGARQNIRQCLIQREHSMREANVTNMFQSRTLGCIPEKTQLSSSVRFNGAEAGAVNVAGAARVQRVLAHERLSRSRICSCKGN